MDNGQEKIDIPEIVYQGDDKKLKERIFKFKAGSLRIAVFTVVGLIMGLLSHNYTQDSFLPTKLILAIPYKINEAIYVSILGTDSNPNIMYLYYTAYFPHSWWATLIAEGVTTVLIGGAIYGSIAYFTGDKRVFTLQRFMKFAGSWCVVILLTIAAAYGVNAKVLADNENLRGNLDYFFLYHMGENGHEGGSGFGGRWAEALSEMLFEELEPIEVQRDWENEIPLILNFRDNRAGVYRINCQERYLITEKGKTYRISEKFAELIRRYYETGELPEEFEALSTISRTEAAGEEAAA